MILKLNLHVDVLDMGFFCYFCSIVLVSSCLLNGHSCGPVIILGKPYFLEGISYNCLVLWSNHKIILY